MKRKLAKMGGWLGLTALIGSGISATAEASLIKMRLTASTASGGTASTTITDDGAGDLAAGDPNTLVFFGSLGQFSLNVTTGTSYPDTALPQLMHLNSIDTGVGDLKIEYSVTGLDVVSPSLGLSFSPSIPAGGTLTWSAYFDQGNGEFAATSLIGTLDDFGTVVGLAPFTTPYSLYYVVNIHHARFSTSSFDADVSVLPPTSVLEPTSMSLLGLGLVGLVTLRRRRATAA